MGAGAESTRRPSFETLVMLTNTASMGTNTRYVETDMNRAPDSPLDVCVCVPPRPSSLSTQVLT